MEVKSMIREGRRAARLGRAFVRRMKGCLEQEIQPDIKLATFLALAQAIRHFDAVVLLWRRGYGEQVHIIARALQILVTYLEFISDLEVSEEERELRAHRFVVYGIGRDWVETNVARRGKAFAHFERADMPQLLQEFYDWYVIPEGATSCRLKDYFYEIKGQPRTTFTSLLETTSAKEWSTQEEVDDRSDYRKEIFSARSSFAHANPDSLVKMVQFDDRGNLTCGLSERQLGFEVARTVLSLIALLGEAENAWMGLVSQQECIRHDEIRVAVHELLEKLN